MNSILVCQKCGSENVAQAQWVNPNNSQVKDSIEPFKFEGSHEICEICNDFTEIIEQKDFKGAFPIRSIEDIWSRNYTSYEGREMSNSERYDLLDEILAHDENLDEDEVLDFIDEHINLQD